MTQRNLIRGLRLWSKSREREEDEGSHPARRATQQWRYQLSWGAVGCQPKGQRRCQLKKDVAVRCNAWEAGGGRLAKQPRSTNTEDGGGVTIFRTPTVPILHLRRECNTREQGQQGNYFTDSPKLATVCWRRKEGCRPCKTLSETRREVWGKG